MDIKKLSAYLFAVSLANGASLLSGQEANAWIDQSNQNEKRYTAGDTNSDKLKKHKVFKEKNIGIKYQIQSLTDRLTTLEADVSNISSQINDLTTEVENNTLNINDAIALALSVKESLTELEMTVIDNATNIEEASMTISMLVNELVFQKIELNNALLEQSAAINKNADTLASLEQSLQILSERNLILGQTLEEKINTLANQNDLNEDQFKEHQTEIELLTGQLAIANAKYNYQETTVNSLNQAMNEALNQLNDLRDTVALLEASLSSGGNNSGENVPALFTFTDKFDTDDSGHVLQLRQFLKQNSMTDKWVYFSYVTPGVNRATEVCFKDVSDVFVHARDLDEHGYTDKIGGDQVFYRLNNDTWLEAEKVRIQSRKLDGYSYLFTGVSGKDIATGALIDLTSSISLTDSYHQRRYLSVESQSDTIVSYTIADNKISACGF